MPSKTFDCKKCNGHHTRPINSKCQNVSQHSSSNSDRPEALSEDLSVKILQELQALSGRMPDVEDRVNQQDQAAAAVASPTRSQTFTTDQRARVRSVTAHHGLIEEIFDSAGRG